MTLIHLAQIFPLECQIESVILAHPGYRDRWWGGICPPRKTFFSVSVTLPPYFAGSGRQESGKGLWNVTFLLEHRSLQPVEFGKDVLWIILDEMPIPSSTESTGDKIPWS